MLQNVLKRVVTAFLLAVVCGQWWCSMAQDAEEKSYTVYFYDQESSMMPPYVYVWQEDGVELTTFDYREPMKFLRKTVEINEVAYPVWSYSFSWDKTPKHLLFTKADASSGKKKTENYVFTPGALYCYDEAGDFSGLTEFPEFAEMSNHVVYLADTQGWTADATLVHIWNQTGSLELWDDNEHMTDTGKYAKVNGRYWPLFEYRFPFCGDPSNVIFHSGNYQTGDLAYSEDGVYYFDGQKVVTEPVSEPEIIDKSDLPKTIVYFADTDSWGAQATQVHIWGSAGDHTPFAQDPTMEDTGCYFRVNDVWAKVYKLEYYYPYDDKEVLFHSGGKLTADCDLIDGALYYYAGNRKPVNQVESPVFQEELPVNKIPGKLYVNLGANQMMQAGLWEEPCAHVYRREAGMTDYESLLPEYGSEEYKAEVMTKVRDGFYEITVNDINDCNDVIFYYSRVNENGEQTYRDLAFPASRGAHNDPSTWATFIYDIGIDCVHQSYLTPAEYDEGWAETPQCLYMTGNSLVTGYADDDPLHSKAIESDEDVYIHKFSIADGDIATFKLSRFDVAKAAANHGFTTSGKDATYDFQRGWATFNLGIIGCQPEEEGWYDKFIYSPGAGQTRQVRLWLNTSMNFNSYTQYPWRIGEGEGGVNGGDYWLVIDLHDQDHSLTLLDFDPNPGITVTPGEISQYQLDYPTAKKLHDGDLLAATDANGMVWFDKVNVVSGRAQIEPVGDEILDNHEFSVIYTIYSENIPVGHYEDVSEPVEIPFIAAGTTAQLAVRARYTHNETGRSFCSRYASGDFTSANPEFPLQRSEITSGTHFRYYKDDNDLAEGVVTVGGVVDLDYGFNDNNPYAYFADYDIAGLEVEGMPSASGHSLVDAGHFLAANPVFQKYLGMYSDNPWQPNMDGDGYGAVNNWSAYVTEEGHLPLLFTELKQGELGDRDALTEAIDAKAYVNLHAIYPFLVRDLSLGQTVATECIQPKLASLESDDVPTAVLPEDLTGFRIVNVRTTTRSEVNFSGSPVSGTENISLDIETADATSAVYYTMGGVKLGGRPELSGIYLMTRGNKTVKVVIR